MENQSQSLIKVFLASPSNSTMDLTEEVKNTLLRAGLEIIAVKDDLDELDFIKEVKDGIAKADCAIHVLGDSYGDTLEFEESVSLDKFQFLEARKRIEEARDDFKMFIWYPPEVLISAKDDNQEQFINEVRTSILKNMMFTNTDSPIRLVDDIRTMMTFDEKAKFEIKDAEVFMIFNELDESEADDIVDMLGDILDSIEKLNIIQESGMDYSEYCVQQIGASKLVTVFFKNTADWALPFTRQIWKKVGGASSRTPILLIGTTVPDSNMNKSFVAPKVVSLIVADELIPLEIKVQYDHAVKLAAG